MMPAADKRLVFTLTCLFCLFQTPVGAQAAASQLIEMESYFRIIWGLLVVLGIILAIYGLVRKRFSLLAASPEKNIKILEIKPLMGKKALCLITVKGNEYLIGMSGDRISHLATLPKTSELSFAATLQSTAPDKKS